MLLSKNNRIIENILKQRLHTDRAKIQVGNISSFGLLEMSRQRLRPSIYEADFITCHHCLGHGRIRSLESLTLKALHQIEEQATNFNEKSLSINIPEKTAIHILNNKRKELLSIEEKRNIIITIIPDAKLNDEEDPLEKIKTINKINNDNKANHFNKNKKDLNNKIKRPLANNKFKKHPKNKKIPLEKLEDKNIKKTETNNLTNIVTDKNNNITNNLSNKKKQKEKKKINANINSSSPVIDNKKPITKTKISTISNKIKIKEKTKIVKSKRKGPAKKGWWNKDE